MYAAGEVGQIKSPSPQKKSHFCNMWFYSGGDRGTRTKQTLHNEKHKPFCSYFLLLFREEITEIAKKSQPNPTQAFTSKKKEKKKK